MFIKGRVFVPFFFLLLAACVNANAERGSDTRQHEPKAGNEVTTTFRIENASGDESEVFKVGEAVRFVFEIRNRSIAPHQLAYTFPPHRVAVMPMKGEKPVWQAWEGQMFMQVMQQKELPAGESMMFSVEWEPAQEHGGTSWRVQPSFHGFLQPGNQPIRPVLTEKTITVQQ